MKLIKESAFYLFFENMEETCLYQSQLWRDIQTKVYGKKSMEIEIFGEKYFCLIKEKKV